MACTIAPSASIDAWICNSGGVRIFNPATSSGALIGANAIRQVAETVFPIAQENEALLLGERREPLESGPVEHAVNMLRTVENEGQRHGGKGGVVFVELALRRQSHVDRAELDLLGLFRRPAQHVIRKNVDLDRAVGALANPAGKLLGSDMGGMILLREMRKAQGHRTGAARNVRSGERDAGDAGARFQECSSVHAILPATFCPNLRQPRNPK